MASSFNTIFPNDLEREINAILLHDAPSMSGTMSLVARRFHTWTKPIQFHTMVIQRRGAWTNRVQELVRFAPFIRVLAFNFFKAQGKLNEEEVKAIRLLILACTETVKHLASTWTVWFHCQNEIGRIHLESLFLYWDWGCGPKFPSLDNLQHPEVLKDLIMFSPGFVENPRAFRSLGIRYLPNIKKCTNLRYVTYAADRKTLPTVSRLCGDHPHLRGVMFLLVNIREELWGEDKQSDFYKNEKLTYANFSTAYLPTSMMILGEWTAKIEGKQSILVHPRPQEVKNFGTSEITPFLGFPQ
ncbi:hypothetical protein DL96DRAFT_1714709 [Flagelloscypha sp. PMI_526]|nr:hypothetical protein DL96DRAFT_1714709 [Flagelloscypha sp. PMI_526]